MFPCKTLSWILSWIPCLVHKFLIHPIPQQGQTGERIFGTWWLVGPSLPTCCTLPINLPAFPPRPSLPPPLSILTRPLTHNTRRICAQSSCTTPCTLGYEGSWLFKKDQDIASELKSTHSYKLCHKNKQHIEYCFHPHSVKNIIHF